MIEKNNILVFTRQCYKTFKVQRIIKNKQFFQLLSLKEMQDLLKRQIRYHGNRNVDLIIIFNYWNTYLKKPNSKEKLLSKREEYSNNGCRDLNTREAKKMLTGLVITSMLVQRCELPPRWFKGDTKHEKQKR